MDDRKSWKEINTYLKLCLETNDLFEITLTLILYGFTVAACLLFIIFASEILKDFKYLLYPLAGICVILAILLQAKMAYALINGVKYRNKYMSLRRNLYSRNIEILDDEKV